MEQINSLSQIAEIVGGEAFLDLAGAETVLLVLLASSLALCMMTFGAARSARKARREAADLAVEIRQLAAQIEASRSARKMVAVGARERTPEAEVEIVAAESDPASTEQLEQAQRAASVPASLLAGFRRRRG